MNNKRKNVKSRGIYWTNMELQKYGGEELYKRMKRFSKDARGERRSNP